MNKPTENFLFLAQEDFEICEYLNKDISKKFASGICFHAQQCVEKSIKAMLTAFNEEKEPLYTHDIQKLLSELSDYILIPDVYQEYAEILTPYATETRYKRIEHVGENESTLAIYYAKQIKNWAFEKINEFEKQNIKTCKPKAKLITKKCDISKDNTIMR